MKKKRKGATLVKENPYRRVMPFLMPTRNGSVVYFDTYVRAEKLEEYLQYAKKSQHRITLTHILIKACAEGLYEHPAMNRYVSGYRIYQRHKAIISFSMKKHWESRSPVKVVKMEIERDETVEQIAEKVTSRLEIERGKKKTYTDNEVNLLTCLPRFMLWLIVKFIQWLDYHNFLPHSFIKNDPMYASVFIANLGSFGMGAGYHHLYEYGNISAFCMVGKIEEVPIVEDGKVVVGKRLPVRFSFDERINDGFAAGKGIDTFVSVLEDPFTHLGPINEQDSSEEKAEANEQSVEAQVSSQQA